MGVKRGRESGSEGGDQVEYEKLRNDRLRENEKRMQELGLVDLSKSLSESARKRGRASPRTTSPIPRVVVAAGPARRSSRLSGGPVVSYAENPKRNSEGKEKKAGRRASEAGVGGYQPEIYTEEDEKLLGDAKVEWQLFVDGYDANGVRIYDPVRGKTCHQCRQKTAGLRTSCSNCQSLRGQFCGDCLYMRYGENVVEANENENWECPVCRQICNCSFCRLKRGWIPTGSLYRKIKSLGYKSVAHYLILTRRGGNEDEEEEVEVVPKDVGTKVKKAPKVGKVKQEMATLETSDEEEASAEVELAPKLENIVGTEVATSLVGPTLGDDELEKPVKVEEVQATLLSAGFRSRRASGEKPNNVKGSDLPVQATNVADENEDVEVEKAETKSRKKTPSGKASFYGSAPRTRRETKPESEVLVLLPDSDSEDSSDFDHVEAVTIAQRLLRRRVT